MLHLFNPGHEYALLNQSPYYTSPSNIVKMQQELAFIAAWYANENDLILVKDDLTEDFKRLIESTKLNIRVVSLNSIEKNLAIIQNQTVSLWGISPQAIHIFQELDRKYDLNLNIPIWDNRLVELGSRKMAHTCLAFLIRKNSKIQTDILPQIHISLESVENTVKESPYKFLAKAPYSSSGRGLLWLPIGQLTRTEKQILHGILKKQSYLTTEKVLNKKLDFAMEFKVDEDISFLGYSLFRTNEKGAYIANYLGAQYNVIKQLTRYTDISLLEEIKNSLIQFIKDHYSLIYKGYIGVDMMIYEEDEQYFLQPCIEINMRNNMGVLAIQLSENYLIDNAEGYLYLDFSSKGDIYNRHLNDKTNYPLIIEKRKIKSGYFELCPVISKNSYRAYIIIEDTYNK